VVRFRVVIPYVTGGLAPEISEVGELLGAEFIDVTR
jgi:hypothetical protein